MLKWILAWLPMVLIAIANGAARDLGYGRSLSELPAQQISTLSGIVLFGIFIWFIVRALQPASLRHAAAIGLLWLGMTLAFEFLFGHYIAGKSWSLLLADYDLAAGRLWPLIPLWVALAPPLFFRLQRRS